MEGVPAALRYPRSARLISSKDLQARLGGHGELALLDVREQGVHYRGHPFYASSAPLSRLELLISVGNDASKRVAARCGYVREGVLRSHHFKGGVREDTEIWSRLPSDAPSDA